MPTATRRRRAPLVGALMLAALMGFGACGDDTPQDREPTASSNTNSEGPLARELRERAEASKAPPEIKQVMQRAQQELEALRLDERALAVGDQAPDVVFEDAAGSDVALADLRANGPVVLAFYRGKW